MQAKANAALIAAAPSLLNLIECIASAPYSLTPDQWASEARQAMRGYESCGLTNEEEMDSIRRTTVSVATSAPLSSTSAKVIPRQWNAATEGRSARHALQKNRLLTHQAMGYDDIQAEDWRVDISNDTSKVACAYHQNDDAVDPDETTMANARLIAWPGHGVDTADAGRKGDSGHGQILSPHSYEK